MLRVWRYLLGHDGMRHTVNRSVSCLLESLQLHTHEAQLLLEVEKIRHI